MCTKIHYVIAVSISLLLGACSKEPVNQSVNTSKETCMAYMAADPALSCFYAALRRIALDQDTAYLQHGPFSFFAPTDAAFAQAGINIANISAMDKKTLKKIIYGHILTGRLGSATVAGFYKLQARCLDTTFRPILSRNYYGLFLNGNSTALSTDLGDGIVHKMDHIAWPGTVTLWQTIKENKALTMLTAAIARTAPPPGQTSPQLNYQEILESGLPQAGWLTSTMLCPTDEAFHTLGYRDVAAIEQLSLQDVRNLLNRHIVRDYYFTADYLMSGVLEWGSPVLKTGGNIIYPKIVQANIKATNGVAHLIDQVILP
ncbi:fasciclin domain-containing protein [Chitinophaga nivalis]|uniref:Fasciclin domain-containing protein n=1 Tax=Chitinophaga nivalis TaxID=2991709 RepID=A0ABT3IJV1_9BACT|nr:fasciclin domain-containing protein [Chitinophaga nivalis]MCW3466068.1 fasciclin domain-containing protein [Chitinophaga nivalis]MCW3484241.1 fasciclin domain-containing protein [Chitinophaga nivalis]